MAKARRWPTRPRSSRPQEGIAEGRLAGAAGKVGALVAERAKKAGVTKVVFDRGGYRYHGHVKALAEGARDGRAGVLGHGNRRDGY